MGGSWNTVLVKNLIENKFFIYLIFMILIFVKVLQKFGHVQQKTPVSGEIKSTVIHVSSQLMLDYN